MTAIYFHNLISLHVSQINSCHILYLQYMRLLTPTPLSIIYYISLRPSSLPPCVCLSFIHTVHSLHPYAPQAEERSDDWE